MRKNLLLLLMAIMSFSCYAQVDLQLGLVGFWQLDNNGLDSSGLHNGTVVGTHPTMDRCGNEQGAMAFPRADGSVILFGDIFDNVFAGAGQQFSFSAWIKPPVTQLPSLVILSKTADVGCNRDERQVAWKLYNGHLLLWYSCDLGPDGSRGIQATSLINNPDQWYHIVAVYDGTQNGNNGLDRVNLYINNQLQNKTLGINHGVDGDIPAGPAPFSIGAYANSDDIICLNSQIFDGAIDEVRVYDRLLDAADVDALYRYNCPMLVDVPTPALPSLQISPNPSDGTFEITGAPTLNVGKVEVYNLAGQLIATKAWYEGMEVDLRTHPSGMYFVRVTWGSGQHFTGKVLSLKSNP